MPTAWLQVSPIYYSCLISSSCSWTTGFSLLFLPPFNVKGATEDLCLGRAKLVVFRAQAKVLPSTASMCGWREGWEKEWREERRIRTAATTSHHHQSTTNEPTPSSSLHDFFHLKHFSSCNWGWRFYCAQTILLAVKKQHFLENKYINCQLEVHNRLHFLGVKASMCNMLVLILGNQIFLLFAKNILNNLTTEIKCFNVVHQIWTPPPTYSFFICRTCSMVTIPAQVKFSLYWLILMDSSHSDTDLKGEPSEPLVLGRRMDTLQAKNSRSKW